MDLLVTTLAVGGSMTYPILILGVLGAVAALAGTAGIIKSERLRNYALALALGLLALGALQLLLAAASRVYTAHEIGAAIEHVNPSDQITLRSAGWSRATNLMIVTLLAAALPFSIGTALFGWAFTRRLAR